MHAAAVVTVTRRHNSQGHDDGDKDNDSEEMDDFDKDGDGKLSVEELKKGFKHVSIRADIMVQRLTLERNLAVMLFKMPNFLMCVLTFIIALMEISPAKNIHNVHRHLKKHFGLGEVRYIVDYHDVYAFLLAFEGRNEEMQATSMKYWCEERYATHVWDDHLMIPVWRCHSPRQFALSLTSDRSWAWSQTNGCSGSGSSSGSSSGSCTSSGSSTSSSSGSSSSGSGSGSTSSSGSSSTRRLGGGGGSGSSALTRPCEDSDEGLQWEEGDSSLTCANFASHVCDIDLGIKLCPLTCGYCSPFRYVHLKKFEKPQVTMLPVMVYQTRFVQAECHGFAHTYEHQPSNELLWFLPSLDGHRHGRTLTCIDREDTAATPYAFELECPDDGPASHCDNSTGTPEVHITEKHTYHGDVIYPKLLFEPHRDVEAMETAEWLDLQTDVFSMSTMVYTEGLEIFTSLTVNFKVDEAGNVDGTYQMISYRDMINGAKTTFIACLLMTSIGAFIGTALSVIHLIRNPGECKWGFTAYELFSRLVLLVYPLVLQISWQQQIPMSVEFDHLLHTFLDLQSTSHEELELATQAYFDVKTHIYHETSWLTKHRICAYITLYIQFLQMIFYFSAHPKMALLTSTVNKAMGSICHFLLLFTVLFFMLAFAAHWMLGEYIDAFGTYGETIKSQGRMIFGEFIYADGADDLNPTMTVMYWAYAFTFMIVVFFTLLNFFLAIIVDAFADVKQENDTLVVVRSFPLDICGVIWTSMLSCARKWPSRKALLDFFEDGKNDGTGSDWLSMLKDEDEDDDDSGKSLKGCTYTPEQFMEQMGLSKDTAAEILCHYYAKSTSVLCRREEGTRRTTSSCSMSASPSETCKNEDVETETHHAYHDTLRETRRAASSVVDGNTRENTNSSVDFTIKYLPKTVSGKPVLIHEGGKCYRLDNRQLQASADGIVFRRSKNFNDKDPSDRALCEWGTRLDGTDEGDGWIRVKLRDLQAS